MTRPEKGSPEWDLWIAAIEVATYPPMTFKGATTQVAVRRMEALRDALDVLGLDWRGVKTREPSHLPSAHKAQVES